MTTLSRCEYQKYFPSTYVVTADVVAADLIAKEKGKMVLFLFLFFLTVWRKGGKSGMTNYSDSLGIKDTWSGWKAMPMPRNVWFN